MKKLALVLVLLLFIPVVEASAQGRKKRPPQRARKPAPAKVELAPAEYEIYVTPVKDFGILLAGVTPLPADERTTDDGFKAFLREHFGVKEVSFRQVRRDRPKVVVRFTEDDDIETLVKTIETVSVSDKIVIELEALIENTRFRVLQKPKNEGLEVKPNPLTLIVRMDEQKRLTLNGAEFGSLTDTSLLSNRLKQVFQERADYGVYRENTNEVETTVIISMPLNSPAGDLIKLGEMLEEAGAAPIAFQAFDDEPERIEIIDLPPGLPLPPTRPRR